VEKNDDLAKHQAVKKSDGLYHSDGERIMKEEVLDAEDFSEEAVEAENIHDQHDNFGIDVSACVMILESLYI